MSIRPSRVAALRTALLVALVLGGCSPEPDRPPLANLGLGLADSALAGGAPGLALKVSEAVLAQHPDDVPALIRRGSAYYELGDNARAIASFHQALALQPQSVEALMGLGRVALATDPAEASARFSQVLTLVPTSADALSDRGIASDLLGLHVEAQADYRHAIGLGANDATVVNLAVSLAVSGDADAAVRMLQPIAASPDASPRVRQDLALALVLDDRSTEAAHILLSQMSQDQAREAIAGYHALKEAPHPAIPDAGGS